MYEISKHKAYYEKVFIIFKMRASKTNINKFIKVCVIEFQFNH